MFVLKEDGTLVAMRAAHFAIEDHFQQQLATHPELLAGDLIDPLHPRRWVLVGREVGIPDRLGGADRWSADHLFLDQDGIPTIVEVKRQTDTRLRREVVSQILEYAANLSLSWSHETIRRCFEHTCDLAGNSPTEELTECLGTEIDPESFWGQVRLNLEARKLRLLFVADALPPELRTIVEFLNQQMRSVEVLALELRQYLGENGLRTIVPTLFGQTVAAAAEKGGESDLPNAVGAALWEARCPTLMPQIRSLLALAQALAPTVEPRFHRSYIGMAVDGKNLNFFTVLALNTDLRLSFHMRRTPDRDRQIEASGMDLLEYKITPAWQAYRLRLRPDQIQPNLPLLRDWMRLSFEERTGR